MPIELTAQAVQHIQTALQQRGSGIGVALRLKQAGCSGWSYHLEFVDQPAPDDGCYPIQSVQIFIQEKLLPYLEGVTLDYVKKGLEEGFTFVNPNEKGKCRCGKSFTV